MTINICGIPHKVVEVDDNFALDLHLGMIDYAACEIRVNRNAESRLKEEILCHEAVHGILMHLGMSDMNEDEQFVQCLANAINQTFTIKCAGDSAVNENRRTRKKRKKRV